jgi:uncharacterized protein YigA (DUF484 family)
MPRRAKAPTKESRSELHKFNLELVNLLEDFKAYREEIESLADQGESQLGIIRLKVDLSKEIRGLVEQTRKNYETIEKVEKLHGDYIHKRDLKDLVFRITQVVLKYTPINKRVEICKVLEELLKVSESEPQI